MSFSQFLRKNHNLQFIKYRKWHVALSLFVIISSLSLYFIKGLHYGIDFAGGIVMEIETNQPGQIGQMRDKIAPLTQGNELTIQEFGGNAVLLVRIGVQNEGMANQIIANIKENIKNDVTEFRRVETVGATIGSELKQSAIYAILGALALMLVYVWFRFEWQFGVGAILALFHDVVGTIGLFALTGMEFNLVALAAILTIAGYSMNDTVVIYDRVRENLQKYKQMPLDDIFNISINETMSRTILTSATTFVSMIALAIFGGSAIQDFGRAMCFGIIIGTYSSIALALPVVNVFRPKNASYSDIFEKNTQKDQSPYSA